MYRLTPWAFLLIAAALLLCATPTAAYSGELTNIQVSDTVSGSETIGNTAYLKLSPLVLRIKDISLISTVDFILVKHDYYQYYINDSSISSGSAPFTINSGGVTASGTLFYNIDYAGLTTPQKIIIWAEFDTFNKGSATGAVSLPLIYDGDEINELFCETGREIIKAGAPSSATWAGFSNALSPSSCISGLSLYRGSNIWQNNLYVDNTSAYYDIAVEKTISSTSYPSTVTIHDADIGYWNGASDANDVSKTIYKSIISGDLLVSVKDPYGDYHNYTLNSAPMPPPIPSDIDFTLALSADTAAVGDPITATLTPAADAPTFTHVMWEYECTNQEEYDYRGGGWYRWNDTASTYSDAVTLADVCTYNFTSYTVGEGLVSCAVFDLTDGFQEVWSGTERAYFGTNAYLCDLSVVVRAASTGYLISGATAKITNARSGVVYNEIPLPIMAGIPFPVYRSQYYYVEVVADGYITENKSVYIPNAETYTVDYSLSLGTSPPPDNTYLRIFVDSPPQSDGYRRPISGAIVQVGSQFKSSDSGGCTVFTVASNTTHSYTVTASGYETATGSVAVGTTLTDVNVHLIESGTASGTPTPATTSAPGSITSHREAMRESMNGLYGNMPTYVGFAFFLLFFVMMKRGMK